MTKETILKQHAWFKHLASGNFTERDFDFEVKGKRAGEESGRTAMGPMPQKRIDLIKGDAQRHLEALEAKFPDLFKAEEAPREPKTPKSEKTKKS